MTCANWIALGCAVVIATAGTTAAPRQPGRAPEPRERVSVNDNRVAAGSLSEGVLTIRLEARRGHWFPDGDDQPGAVVKAFAVEGGPLQVPGPIVRVPEGTEIRAVVTNRLVDEPLALHGLYSRPGTANAPVVLQAGETRTLTFRALVAGTFYYWGATAAETAMADRAPADTQLSGAIVVDPKGATSPPGRVLVIGNWNNGAPVGTPERHFRFVINGRSWPATERLSHAVGETVRMRVLNLGGGTHPMHLHGFYFKVDSRGDEAHDTIYPATSSPRMAVTERLASGETFSLTWKPTRPGNWLFHCHDNVHLDHGGPIDDATPPPAPAHHGGNHALEMMAGPVLGITVTGASAEPPEPAGPRRQLRLTARVDAGGTAAEPAFGYTLDSGTGVETPATGPLLPGPTILLKRGEPVSITVTNQLPEPTSVHWHGMELESYYDGVADFAGDGTRMAPAIPSGGSFEARFTPPRAGTFIYHTHLDDTRQQQAGLSGALLVLDDPGAYDPAHDIVLMTSIPRKSADGNKVLVNGSLAPALRELEAGRRYRLRLINIHTSRPNVRMQLLQGAEGKALMTWRPVAKDGADLPADQRTERPSAIQMGNGETYDFEFVAAGPGPARFDVTAGNGTLLSSTPIRIK